MKICPTCNHHFSQSAWICPECNYTPLLLSNHLAFAPNFAHATHGFESHFFSTLALLEAKNFWFRSRNRLILWALQAYFKRSQTFLEIGCGTGFVLQAIEKNMPHLKLSGSEIFSAGLEFAQSRLVQTSLFQMDARQIPFAEEFDVIGAFDVLEHIKEDRVVLRQIYQSLRHGGGIIVTVPQHSWLWSPSDDYAHHVRRYSHQELCLKLKQAGFEIVKTTSFVSLLLPLMILSRLSKRNKPQNYDPLSEFRISKLLNFLLEKILDFERLFVKLGCTFPLGGSLLAIAYKK